MTNEELCLRVQAGDTDAAEELICRNMGFIHKIAEQYKSLAEMGRLYHLSESRAKRTEEEAIGKLRTEMKHHC